MLVCAVEYRWSPLDTPTALFAATVAAAALTFTCCIGCGVDAALATCSDADDIEAGLAPAAPGAAPHPALARHSSPSRTPTRRSPRKGYGRAAEHELEPLTPSRMSAMHAARLAAEHELEPLTPSRMPAPHAARTAAEPTVDQRADQHAADQHAADQHASADQHTANQHTANQHTAEQPAAEQPADQHAAEQPADQHAADQPRTLQASPASPGLTYVCNAGGSYGAPRVRATPGGSLRVSFDEIQPRALLFGATDASSPGSRALCSTLCDSPIPQASTPCFASADPALAALAADAAFAERCGEARPPDAPSAADLAFAALTGGNDSSAMADTPAHAAPSPSAWSAQRSTPAIARLFRGVAPVSPASQGIASISRAAAAAAKAMRPFRYDSPAPYAGTSPYAAGRALAPSSQARTALPARFRYHKSPEPTRADENAQPAAGSREAAAEAPAARGQAAAPAPPSGSPLRV